MWDTGPITLDPAISGELSSHNYIMQIFSGLVYLDDNLEIKADIADKWQISPDGKTYTFYLKKNVRFHDGRILTADDIKYSWERACLPATGSNTSNLYLSDIVGTDRVFKGETTSISGISILDSYALQVSIDAPKAYFLSKLAYPTAFIIDKYNVASGKDWWLQPNGTGPFKLSRWTQGSQITLTRNDDFYREPALLAKVEYQLLSGNPIELYEVNKIDTAQIFEQYIDAARDPSGPFSGQLHEVPELGLNYIGFNVDKPPFDDVNIRLAFCHAFNKEKIIRVINKDTVRNALGIIPPGMPGYNPNLQGYEFDIQKAKRLISESKYGSVENLPPVTITIAGLGNYLAENLGAIIQDWQNNLGVQINVRQLETEIFLYHIREEVDNMFFMGWVADYPDPQDFLDYLLKTGSLYNAGNYSNPQVDSLLVAAAVEQNTVKRLEMYQQAEQLLMHDAAMIPLTNGINLYLVKPYLKEYKLNPVGMPSLARAYIER